MIKELVDLAGRIRQKEKNQDLVHDALCEERLDAYICITREGKFLNFIPTEKGNTIAEDVVRTENKGRTSNILARLLVDNEKYVLGYPITNRNEKCLTDYVNKLCNYENIKSVKSVIDFYERNKELGLVAARNEFENNLQTKKLKTGTNFSFLIRGKGEEDIVVHLFPKLIEEVKRRYEEQEKNLKGNNQDVCSICGKSDYRVRNLSTHGTIDGVIPRNPLGNYLISYEGDAFSSYDLDGNDNSLVCTHCAKAYVEAMNWLLAPRSWIPTGKKNKKRPDYKNRKDISDDTQVVFWLRNAVEPSFLDILDNPTEESIHSLFDSVYSGSKTSATKLDADTFYSLTLRGAAARIAIRDWIETSLDNLQSNLVRWFQDIEITRFDTNEKKISKYYPRFNSLVLSAKSKSDSTVQHGRIGAVLWKSAVLGFSPPLWLLNSILNRIRAEQSEKPPEGKKNSQWEYKLPERIALLKLYLNRINKQNERNKIMAELDETNKNTAYICGRIFAVLESIQYFASGGNLNAGIRERFFSFASTMPSTAFGRLMKLTQHHLSKISGEKPGLAVDFDKKLQELICKLEGNCFPAVFSLEDQACFAIGYYHQKQKEFSNKSNNKETQS